MKRLISSLLLILVCSPAFATGKQPRFSAAYSGATTAISANGYPVASGSLFTANIAKLLADIPISVAYWIRGSGWNGNATILSTINSAHTQGWAESYYINGSTMNPFGFNLVDVSFQSACAIKGSTCVREQLMNDNNWHHVCRTWDGTTAISYIDGVRRDLSVGVGGTNYVPSTQFWQLYDIRTFLPANLTTRDWRYYGRILSPNECRTLTTLGNAGLIPTGAPFTTSLIANWRMDACDGSGCIDSIAPPANLIYDNTPPIVTITAPAAGAVAGPVAFTATCVDTFSCVSVTWFVDGVPVNLATTSPYTYSWDSTTFLDGAHIITATAINIGGTPGSATVAVTTANGVTAKNYFYAASGSDANVPCTNSASPCLSIVGSAIIFHGGDTISYHAGDVFTWSASHQNPFVGPGGLVAGVSTNTYAGGVAAPILVSTYGGGTCDPQGGVTTGCVTWNASGASIANAFIVQNVSNLTIEKQVAIGTGNPTAVLAPPSVNGIQFRGFGTTLPYSGLVARNNQVVDIADGINVNNTTPNTLTGCTVQNNVLIGSTTTVTNANGISSAGPGCDLSANVIENINGNPAQGFNSQTGNGIAVNTTQSSGAAKVAPAMNDEFNVTLTGSNNVGGTAQNCGNDFANWVFGRYNVTFQFNEAAFWVALVGSPSCDTGSWDLDGGSAFITLQYSYSHDNFGYMGFFPFGANGGIWHDNIIRFNISENDGTGGTSFPIFNIANATFVPTETAIYNNTFFSNFLAKYCIFLAGDFDSKFYNNICHISGVNAGGVTPGYFVYNLQNVVPRYTLDYNLYYSTTNSGWFCLGASKTFTTWKSDCNSPDAHGLNADPLLNAPGTGGTVYTGTGAPTLQPLPSGYLGTAPSPGKGTGLAVIPSQTFSRDYYNNSCPGAQGGSGVSMGADGCGNP